MKELMRKAILFAAMGCLGSIAYSAARPQFSFGVISDVQYAGQDTRGKRDYRGALPKLEEFVAAVNAARPAFAIQLGDLIDTGAANLKKILPVYEGIHPPRYHVLGNHDFCMDRASLLSSLGLRSAYYSFSHKGWRFVVLDGMDVSTGGGWPAGSENHRLGLEMLLALRQQGAKNAVEWNGGIGAAEKQWLVETLTRAATHHERVIVFSHFPILEQATTPHHLLWNHQEILRLIESSGCVAAYINGHDHNGGYARHNGIHYVTFPAVVESGPRNAFAFIDVYGDRLELRGTGTVISRSLELNAKP